MERYSRNQNFPKMSEAKSSQPQVEEDLPALLRRHLH
jgi:hypothetical protein